MTNGFAVSVPGNGHIRRELPCQDASGVWFAPRPVAIVCDGRGSARLSQLGAQAAVRAFRSQCAVLDGMLAQCLDSKRRRHGIWRHFCRLMIRTLVQPKLELAEQYGLPEKEFDFTVVFAVCGRYRHGVFQLGDGAVTVRGNGTCRTVFRPDKGEFDNMTSFLRPGDEKSDRFRERLLDASEINGIALTSDGPEHLMFELPAMRPGPVFDAMFDDLASGKLTRQDLLDYLTGARWTCDPRGADDRSIVILNPREGI